MRDGHASVLAGVALLLAATMSANASAQRAEAAIRPCQRIYAVVYELRFDSEGRITAMTMSGFSGSESDAAEAARVAGNVPEEFHRAARMFLSRRSYRGERSPSYTFVLYDPAQPGRTDIQSVCRRAGATS